MSQHQHQVSPLLRHQVSPLLRHQVSPLLRHQVSPLLLVFLSCLLSLQVTTSSRLPLLPMVVCGCLEEGPSLSGLVVEVGEGKEVTLDTCGLICSENNKTLFGLTNTDGSCLCGDPSTSTLLCEEEVGELVEMFCLVDLPPPLTINQVISVHGEGDVEHRARQHQEQEEKEPLSKGNMKILALVLGLFAVLCLLVAALRTFYQLRKTRRKDALSQEILAGGPVHTRL